MGIFNLPGFEVIEKLGEGGMASVWKARQLSLDRIVAVKILSQRFSDDIDDVQRFQSESQSAAKLKNPGIIQIYDAASFEGVYYFVMEFIDGYTVGEWIRRKGVLTEQNALLVAECVADALEYGWKKEGLIHCDIKPDNIMVDDDGTVKVADLGLSRTIHSFSDNESDDVMGTPAYMSPEQATGSPDLDCRSDIYALGAMMFHMVTGRHLFQGHSDDDVMQYQLDSADSDPYELNPSLSPEICALIELMLAKSPDDRPESWGRVLHEIKRVKNGHMPERKKHHEFVSTILCSSVRPEHVPASYEVIRRNPSGAAKVFVSILLLLAVLAGGGLWLKSAFDSPASSSSASSSTLISDDAEDNRTAELKHDDLKQRVDQTRKWVALNPDSITAAIKMYEEINSEPDLFEYEQQVKGELLRLNGLLDREIGSVVRSLEKKIEPMLAEKRYDDALDAISDYDGSYRVESAFMRDDLSARVRTMRAEYRAENMRLKAQVNAKYDALIKHTAELVLEGELNDAYKELKLAESDSFYSSKIDSLSTIAALIRDASTIDQKILKSFESDVGRTINIATKKGVKRMTLKSVSSDSIVVMGSDTSGSAKYEFEITYNLSDLASSELEKRMGSDSFPDVALVKGISAFRAGKNPKKYFSIVHPDLSIHLISLIRTQMNRKAESALKSIMVDTLGMSVGKYDKDLWVRAVSGLHVEDAKKQELRSVVQSFRDCYGQTEFASEAEPVLMALANPGSALLSAPDVNTGNSDFPLDDDAVTDDEYSERTRALRRGLFEKCKKLNRGVRSSDLLPKFKNGQLVSLRISSSELRSLSFLAGESQLKVLKIDPHKRCPLSSITSISRLPIEDLCLSGTSVKDLSPLSAMPLKRLDLHGSLVRSLEPLRGMKLKHLDVSNTGVSDLSPLREVPLELFNGSGTKIYSVSSLNEDTLSELYVSDTQVRGLLPVKNARLRKLDITNTSISDLHPLTGMPIILLKCDGTKISMPSVIFTLPLEELYVDRELVSRSMARRIRTLKKYNGNYISTRRRMHDQ